ncbi:hypothetical protein OEA41_002281 [Lepraria neglecta]|uniref:Uncharacterized protein n=1 Tax=Lepraria neglecta TaxID=209136 RepID=A0AAE0DML1_9LECA|nr:hypothetical protein OEA41_002281 [Lepraria neglecta]
MNAISLPQREGWNTSDVMSCGDDYTPEDAATIMMQFWHEWADNFEARLLQLVDQTDFTEICGRDDMDLIRKFSKYPDRPSIQPGSSQETQGSLLDRAWHQWAADVEGIFFALKDCLARGKANPKAHMMTFYTLDDKVSACPIPSLSQGDELSKVLCALLWVSGVKFSASSDGMHDLMGGMEKMCLESGTYSRSGRLSEEMAIRMKKLTL